MWPMTAKQMDLVQYIWYLVSPILILSVNTRCEPQSSVTNTKCEVNIPRKVLGDYRFTIMLQVLSLTKWFDIQISITRDDISSQATHKRR